MLFHRTTGRPARWLTRILAVGFSLLALDGLFRAQQAVVHWRWLEGVGLQPGPLYVLISGLLVAGAGAAGLISALRGGAAAVPLVAGGTLAAAAWYWIDRLLVAQGPGRLNGSAFSALVTLLGLAAVAAWLAGMRRSRDADPGSGD